MKVRKTRIYPDTPFLLPLILNGEISDKEFRLYCYFTNIGFDKEFTNPILAQDLNISRRQIEYLKKSLIDKGLIFTDRLSQHEYILYVGDGGRTAMEVRKEWTDDPIRPFTKINSNDYPESTSEIV